MADDQKKDPNDLGFIIPTVQNPDGSVEVARVFKDGRSERGTLSSQDIPGRRRHSNMDLEPCGDAFKVVRERLAAEHGPAQVATSAYRTGWETIFGKKEPAGQA